MKDLQIGDALLFGHRRIAVNSLKQVRTPSGATDVRVNLGSGFPLFGDAEEMVSIAVRRTDDHAATTTT